MADTLLEVNGISIEYATRAGPLRAVDNVSLDISRGEILGLVGESGSGKSTLGRALLRMIEPPGSIVDGTVLFDGVDLISLSEREMSQIRGTEIGMVFQDPMTSLVPVEKISTQIRDTVKSHDRRAEPDEIDRRAKKLLERLGIHADRLHDYPHQLSGGMRQRVMIAIALILDARLLIADEPTTALDVVVEAHFVDLLRELRDELDLTILFISHNIGVIAEVADRVAVMYAGRLVEVSPVEELFVRPKHPYTEGLLRSVPRIDVETDSLYKMDGTPPNLRSLPAGCPFHPRCPRATEVCSRETPVMQQHGLALASCWNPVPEDRA